ncbi:MAG: YciI family protein [Oscillospiraceae bacterium]|jgi:uncharacterized protein YciI|nr:YciI family protein [Oscillospiraceae bacterium]
MHFLLTAYDGKDSEASTRRSNAREQHLECAKKLIKARKLLYAAAILDDEGKMIGSIMIVDFPSRDALTNEWLNNEPYILGDVWKDIDIKPCYVPDFILNMEKEKVQCP